MGSDRTLNMPLCHARPTNKKGNADILLKSTGLSRRETVLADMEPVVRSEDDVSIVNLATIFQTSHKRLHKFIDTLQRAQARTVKVIVVVDL